MCNYVTPNDNGIIGNSDSESIQNAITFAAESEIRKVLIPRINKRTGKNIWDIEKAIILTSNIEIILDDCMLRQADGVFDNVFRSHATTEEAQDASAQIHDVRIIGRGKAVIDGGIHNGIIERDYVTKGGKHMSLNNMILLLNTKNFVIEGISFENQRFWALNFAFAEYGRLSNLHFWCECENPNLDGIDLRNGCHDIIIENITGQSGDDLIALSAIGCTMFTADRESGYRFSICGRSEDIHDITIKNVIGTSVDCAIIALRATDGRKIYNVTIDNIHDVDNGALEAGKAFPEYPKATIDMDIRRNRKGNHPYALLRIGQHGYFRERANVLGEVYGITATNLYSRGGVAIMINVSLQDSYFSNIHADNDVDYVITTKSGRTTQKYGADIKNVVFENIFYGNTDNEYATAFDFDINQTQHSLENVIINRAFLGNCKKIFNLKQNGRVIFHDLYGQNVKTQSGEIFGDDH